MTTFFEANQARLALKMQLSNYSWYRGCGVVIDDGDGYAVLIGVSHIDGTVQKTVPKVYSNVIVKTEVEK